MDDQAELPESTRSPALPIAIVAVVLAAASAAVIFFVMSSSSGNEFRPIAVAELAPADTHFFMAFNTDFASDPWVAVPRLLRALDIEQAIRDDLDDSAAEEDLDYDDDIAPALGTIERAGIAAQYTSDGGELVAFIDSRDPQRVLDIGFGTAVLDSEERDEELGIDFKIYFDSSNPTDSPTAVATHDGIIYVADSPDHISNLIRRQQSTDPLSDSERFRTAIEEVTDDALLVAFGNGNVLDQRDLRDIVDAFADSSEIDPRDGTLAFAVTARDDGFGARVVIALESGFGTFEQAVTEPVDLVSIASMTPDDALVFFAGSGLHESLAQGFEDIESDPLVADTLAPFEDLSGVSVKDDLIPLFGNSYAIATGGDGFTSDTTDLEDVWALGLIESSDPARLSELLNTLIVELEIAFCACDSGVTVEDDVGYVRIQWPDNTLSDASLVESPAFTSTLELLPRDPTNLLFVNVSALPEDLLRETSADWGADPEGYAADLTAILGFGMGTYADETSIAIDFVLPIASANGE